MVLRPMSPKPSCQYLKLLAAKHPKNTQCPLSGLHSQITGKEPYRQRLAAGSSSASDWKAEQLGNKSFRFFFPPNEVCKTNFPQNRAQFPLKKAALTNLRIPDQPPLHRISKTWKTIRLFTRKWRFVWKSPFWRTS